MWLEWRVGREEAKLSVMGGRTARGRPTRRNRPEAGGAGRTGSES